MVIMGGYRLHWATLAVSAVVLLYLLELQHSGFACGRRRPGEDMLIYGWPLRFFERAADAEARNSLPKPGVAIAVVRTLANPLCCIALLASTAAFVERALRRGFIRSFTLGSAFAATTVLCGLLALSQTPRELQASRLPFAGGALSLNLIHMGIILAWWDPFSFPLILAFAATMHTAGSLIVAVVRNCATIAARVNNGPIKLLRSGAGMSIVRGSRPPRSVRE